MTEEEWYECYDNWFDTMEALVWEYLKARPENTLARLGGEIEEMLNPVTFVGDRGLSA